MEAPRRSGYRVVSTYVSRGVQAAIFVTINYLIFFIAPTTLFGFGGQLTPDVEATILRFSSVIIVLTVARIMLKDHPLGRASAVGLGLVEVIYLYTITEGGVLSLSVSGFHVTVEFKPILYLMMTPPLLGVVKQILDAAHKSATQPVTIIEAAT